MRRLPEETGICSPRAQNSRLPSQTSLGASFVPPMRGRGAAIGAGGGTAVVSVQGRGRARRCDFGLQRLTGRAMKRRRAKPSEDAPTYGASREHQRIHAAALAACVRPYPATARGQAFYWDELISTFARIHGVSLTVKVFGVEAKTASEVSGLPSPKRISR